MSHRPLQNIFARHQSSKGLFENNVIIFWVTFDQVSKYPCNQLLFCIPTLWYHYYLVAQLTHCRYISTLIENWHFVIACWLWHCSEMEYENYSWISTLQIAIRDSKQDQWATQSLRNVCRIIKNRNTWLFEGVWDC